MARRTRILLPGALTYIVLLARRHEAAFLDEGDYIAYLAALKEGARRHACMLHAYALLPDGVHILATPKTDDGIGKMMRYTGTSYAHHFNSLYDRTGTPWEGRYRSTIIGEKAHIQSALHYLETTPVRAGLVNTPRQWKWSSYPVNALGKESELLVPHRFFSSANEHKELCKKRLSEEEVVNIEQSWRSGLPLGSEVYRKKLEKQLKRPMGYGKPGRPRKESVG